MNAVAESVASGIKRADLPAIGSALGGGWYTGVININGAPHALITASKCAEIEGEWGCYGKTITGADSYADGLANTKAMAEAGSEIAQKVLAQTTSGFTDWAIPARDQQELQYRAFKPGDDENSCSFRDGDNPSSMPAGYPYTEQSPAQSSVDAFKIGGDEAFETSWYFASTQYAHYSDGYAWGQGFYYGLQDGLFKSGEYFVRPVRTLPITD